MEIKIGNKKIGGDNPVFIVAELGINHNGNVAVAKKMMQAAKKAGADAVKLQSFITEDFVGDKNLMYTYKSKGKTVTESQYKMFKRYELDKKKQKELFDFAKKINLVIFSTPQNNSYQTVEYLCGKEINMPAIKVGSDDLTNLPLLEYYARKKRPMIISTGMATIDEIEDAVRVIEETGNKKIVILKCTSLYPTPSEEANLSQIKTLQYAFDYVIGYSDHTSGSTAAVIATVLGAKMIEKHFTLSKDMAGPDHWFSADLQEFALLVKQAREAEKMLGRSQIILSNAERKMKLDCRRSITVVKQIKKGEIIKKEQIEMKRPGSGLPSKYLPFVIGRTAKKDFPENHIILFKDL